MKEMILVVDDEKSIADVIAYALKREGYDADVAYDGEEALEKINILKPKVVILDVMMPKINGFDVCKKINDKGDIGIIMLTAKNDIVDKVLGLEFGADDYITKPFDIREIIARVNSLARRLEQKKQAPPTYDLEIKELKIMIQQRIVTVEEVALDLTPKEFDLLILLLTNSDRVFTRENLLDLVWEMDYFGGTRTVDIHIQRLRKKLGDKYKHILQTVHRIGYKAIGDIYE